MFGAQQEYQVNSVIFFQKLFEFFMLLSYVKKL